MTKIYTKPTIEIAALKAEDIIMTSVAPVAVSTTVNGNTAASYGETAFDVIKNAITNN